MVCWIEGEYGSEVLVESMRGLGGVTGVSQ